MATENDSNLAMRSFNLRHTHRYAESSRSFIGEKCARCRERYPLGVLDHQTKLCSLCEVEIGIGDFDDRYEWEQRLRRNLEIR